MPRGYYDSPNRISTRTANLARWTDGIVLTPIFFCSRAPLDANTRIRMIDHGGYWLCKFPGEDASGVFQATKTEVREL